MMQEGVSLKKYTTMRTGGNARYFFAVRSVGELAAALMCAEKQPTSFVILGGGSNTLFSDNGFDGVVIKMEIGGMEFVERGDKVYVRSGAGVVWDEFVATAVERNLFGVENLSHIPGTVGAAPVQNIGAYGTEVREVIVEVEVFDTQKKCLRTLDFEACRFGYRDSIFKHPEGRHFVIVSVTFALKKFAPLRCDYSDLAAYFAQKKQPQSPADIRNALYEIRSCKLPDIRKVGCAGSFFKNPEVDKKTLDAVLAVDPKAKYFPQGGGTYKLSAAYLIDKIGGWKGRCEQGVCAHDRQPLALVNVAGAATSDVLAFAQKIRKDIFEKVGVMLEYEVNVV